MSRLKMKGAAEAGIAARRLQLRLPGPEFRAGGKAQMTRVHPSFRRLKRPRAAGAVFRTAEIQNLMGARLSYKRRTIS